MKKKKDIEIISRLRKNARAKLSEISRETSIPVSTIFDRLRVHEGSGIMRHTTLVDFSELGFTAKAFVAVKTSHSSRKELKEFLNSHAKVNNLFLVNHHYDFLFEVVARNLKDLRDFMDSMEERFEIRKKEEHILIEDLKREHFLSDPNLLGL